MDLSRGRRRRSFPTLVPFAAALALAVCCRAATAAESTTERIVRTGRIAVGASDAYVPISYRGPSGEHIGFQMDICRRVIEAIRQRHGMPRLQIVTVPVTNATNMAMLTNGTTDIECGPSALNSASLQQALLTHATLANDLRLMTLAEQAGYAVADLNGKTVGLIVGGRAAARLRVLARDRQLKVTEKFVREPGDVFGLLADGRVDAVASNLPYLLAHRLRSGEPQRYAVLDIPLGIVYWTIMFRLEDEGLRAIANEVIEALARTGELGRLYDKWFMQPIPGLPAPVNLPISPYQREIIEAPGSEMLKM